MPLRAMTRMVASWIDWIRNSWTTSSFDFGCMFRPLNERSVNQNFRSAASKQAVNVERRRPGGWTAGVSPAAHRPPGPAGGTPALQYNPFSPMIQPGSRLGRYEIRALLGAGGMGEVYLAHDEQLQRPVALKVLGRSTREDAELRKRLEQEARAASALNHPNILTVYDVGFAGDEQFIATEFIDGITLRQRMIRAEPGVSEVLDVAIQILSALAAAEAAGLVHRDIKPDNVMLRSDGYIKLLDFGLARPAITTDHNESDPSVVKGTVFYMSPEQLRGLLLDTRSDLWSTGVVMYELISGRLPFEGVSSAVVASNILRAEAPPLTRRFDEAVPLRLAAIVSRALVKDRAKRYQSAREMLDELHQLRADLVRDASAIQGTSEARLATTEDVTVDATVPTNLPVALTPLI